MRLPPRAITQNANHAPAEPTIMMSTIGTALSPPEVARGAAMPALAYSSPVRAPSASAAASIFSRVGHEAGPVVAVARARAHTASPIARSIGKPLARDAAKTPENTCLASSGSSAPKGGAGQ